MFNSDFLVVLVGFFLRKYENIPPPNPPPVVTPLLAWFFYTQTKRYANAKSSTGNLYM